MEYEVEIFSNGRFAIIPEKDYSEAIEQNKEILVFCGGWSGGYARAFGANREPDYYDVNHGNDCFSCYAYDIKDEIFTPEQLTKFYRVIVTDGIKVYMKTGEPATSYFGGRFVNWDTTFEDYKRQWYANKNINKEQFEEMRHEVDKEKTLKMVWAKDKEEEKDICEAISDYLY